MASHMSIEVEQRPKRNLKTSFLILVVLLVPHGKNLVLFGDSRKDYRGKAMLFL